jgi:hypothetical protein
MSQATDSLRRITFRNGLGKLKVFLNNVPVGRRAYCDVSLKVFSIVSGIIQP